MRKIAISDFEKPDFLGKFANRVRRKWIKST